MLSQKYDVLGLGNAIVDVLASAEDDFLIAHDLRKGAMTLVDEGRAEELTGTMAEPVVVSGGSAANTIIGAASLGCKTAFFGKVKADRLGGLFASDIQQAGVAFPTAPAAEGPATARCLIFVTPDGQRTMNTYLGACQNLTEADVDPETVRDAGITYLEGYLWDPPAAKAAFVKAARIANEAGRRVALSLSDAFCVDRYRDEFLNLVRTKAVTILFANESELHALYQTSDFDTAIALLRQENILGVVTRGAEGSIVVTQSDVHPVAAHPIETLVDTTGAGDLFAAGFLAGLSRGKDLVACAKLGGLAAAEIIQHIGARPKTDLKQLAAAHGLG